MIEDSIIDIVYFARISWAEAWTLSAVQRDKVATRIMKYKKIESGNKDKQILGD